MLVKDRNVKNFRDYILTNGSRVSIHFSRNKTLFENRTLFSAQINNTFLASFIDLFSEDCQSV